MERSQESDLFEPLSRFSSASLGKTRIGKCLERQPCRGHRQHV